MDQRAINAYQKNAIMTASKAELTLMLYDGAIKFCNIALSGFEKKEYEKMDYNVLHCFISFCGGWMRTRVLYHRPAT